MDSAVSPQDVRTSPKPTRTTDEETETNSAASGERVVPVNRKDVISNAETTDRQQRCLMDWNDIVHDRSGSSPETSKREEVIHKYGRRRRVRRRESEDEVLSEHGGVEQVCYGREENDEQRPLRIGEPQESAPVDVAIGKLRIDTDAAKQPSPDEEREVNLSSSKKLPEDRTGRPTPRRQRLYEGDSIDKNPWPHDKFESINREIEEESRFSRKMYSDRKEELARQTRAPDNRSSRGRQMDDDRVERRPYQRASFGRRAGRPAAAARTGSMRARMPDFGNHPRYYEDERAGNRRRDYPARNNDTSYRRDQYDDRRMEPRRAAPLKSSFRGMRRDYYSRDKDPEDDWSYRQERPNSYGRQPPPMRHADRIKSISDRSDESYDRRGRPSPSDELLSRLPSIPQNQNRRVYNKQNESQQQQQFVRYSHNRRRSADLRENGGGRRFARDSKPTRYPIAPRYERAAERQARNGPPGELRKERASTETPDRNTLVMGTTELPERGSLPPERAPASSSNLSPYASPFRRESEGKTLQQSNSVPPPPASQPIIPFGSEVTFAVPPRGATLVLPQQQAQALQACFQPGGGFSLAPAPPGSQLFGTNSAASPYICYTGQQIPAAAAFPSVSGAAEMLPQQQALAVSALQAQPYQIAPGHIPLELLQNPAQYINSLQRSAFLQQQSSQPASFSPTAVPFQPVYGVDYFNHVAAANEYVSALMAAQAASQRAPQQQQSALTGFPAVPAQGQNLPPISQGNNTYEQRADGSGTHPQFIPQ